MKIYKVKFNLLFMLNYEDRWPIAEVNGKDCYLKYKTDFSSSELRTDYDLPFNSMISFRIAQVLGFEFHPNIAFHVNGATVSSAEEIVGKTLNYPPFEFDVRNTPFTLHDDKSKDYKELQKRVDDSMVQGDIYRVFSLTGDSEYPHNIAFDGEHIRWIDFGYAFSDESFGYCWNDVQRYYRKQRSLWKSKGDGLLERIKDLSDEQIKDVVLGVVHDEAVAEIIANPVIKSNWGLTRDEYSAELIHNILARRNGFRDLRRFF